MFQGLEMKVTRLYGLALTPASVEISSPYTMYIYTVIIFFYVFFRPLLPLFYWLSQKGIIGHQQKKGTPYTLKITKSGSEEDEYGGGYLGFAHVFFTI